MRLGAPQIADGPLLHADGGPLESRARFDEVVTAALNGGVLRWPDAAGEPDELQRRWWEQPPGPRGSRDPVWSALKEQGTLAEVASWSECGNLGWLQVLLSRLVVDHQCRKALLGPNDPVPARWGALGVEATAALWKIGRAALAMVEGRGETDSAREQAMAWLATLPGATPGWGDLIIFHKLAPALATWLRDLEREIDQSERDLAAARALIQAREQTGWWGREAAKRRAEQAKDAERQAARRVANLGAAAAWLREVDGKWAAADAIGRLPAFGDRGALALPPPGPRVEGLEMWAVRETAGRCPHTPAALVLDHLAMRAVFGERLQLREPVQPSDPPERWRARGLALEIYRMWFGHLSASIDPQPLVMLLESTNDEQLESYGTFFEPWHVMTQGRYALDGMSLFEDKGDYRALSDLVFREIGDRMEIVRVDLTVTCLGPLRASDFATWGGARLAWFRDHLDAIGLEGHTFAADAWPRLLDLARFYRRWGELTATRQQVEAAGFASFGSDAIRTLLLPWCRLQAASQVARLRRPNIVQAPQFLAVYDAIPRWIQDKLNDLWGGLGNRPAVPLVQGETP